MAGLLKPGPRRRQVMPWAICCITGKSPGAVQEGPKGTEFFLLVSMVTGEPGSAAVGLESPQAALSSGLCGVCR